MLLLQPPAEDALSWPAAYGLLALQEILLIGLPAWLIYMRNQHSRERLKESLHRPEVLQVGLVSLAAVSFTLASLLVSGFWLSLLQSIAIEVPLQMETIVPKSGGELAAALLVAALLPAVCEELLFRGLLFDWLEQKWGRRLAVWVSAFLFSALHFSVIGFGSLLAIGLYLGALRRRYGGVLLPMLFHALYNAAVLVLNTLNANPSPQAVMLCGVVFAGVSSALFRKERVA